MRNFFVLHNFSVILNAQLTHRYSHTQELCNKHKCTTATKRSPYKFKFSQARKEEINPNYIY